LCGEGLQGLLNYLIRESDHWNIKYVVHTIIAVIAATPNNFNFPGALLKSPQNQLIVIQDKLTNVAPNQKPARAETRAPRYSPNK
jgi:hypothetical protein